MARRTGVSKLSAENFICGVEHPRLENTVCTKPSGRSARHGRRHAPMRCVLWEDFHGKLVKS